MKRITALFLGILLLLSAFSAMAESKPFEEVKQFTIMMPSWQTEGDNEMHKVWSERMNAEITFITAPTTAYAEKLSSVLASNQLPDIISFATLSSDIPETWVNQGALIPLDDLIAEYGQDYASWINADNELFISKYDGKQYFLYQFNSFPYMNTVCVRQDWLDKLGLETPETLDGWIEVWRAFRDQDPNENGLKDEYALNGNFKTILNSAYGIKPVNGGRFALDVDGSLVSKFEHSNYEAWLKTCTELFAEGLIDPEYMVRDDTSYKQLIITGVVGMNANPGNECASFTTAIRETYPDAMLKPVAPIAQLDGEKGSIMGRSPLAQCTGITATAKDPEGCMQLLNYLFTEEGYLLTNFGVEGVTFDYVNDVPKLREGYNTWADLRAWGMNPISLIHPWNGDQFLQVTLAGKTYEELDEVEKLAYHGYFDSAPYVYYDLPASIFSGESYNEYATEIFTELNDMENNVIMGLATMDDFKALLADVKAYALDDITAEVQANYEAVK